MNKKIKPISKKEFRKQIKGKKIVFHKDFDLGWRIAMCQTCGIATPFVGCLVDTCDVCEGKLQAFNFKDTFKFLAEQQKTISKFYSKTLMGGKMKVCVNSLVSGTCGGKKKCKKTKKQLMD